jgi:hypothetical protein
MKRYFSFDDQGEFRLHDTLEQAKKYAEITFRYCADEAREDWWPDNTENVCYGELVGGVEIESVTQLKRGGQRNEYELVHYKQDRAKLHQENEAMRKALALYDADNEYAHRLAVMLECALISPAGAWDDAHKLLHEYRTACKDD